MTGELTALREQAEAELRKAETEEELLTVRTRYLGRKGLLTGLLRNIGNVLPEERPEFGKRCNEVKEYSLRPDRSASCRDGSLKKRRRPPA